MNNLKFNEEQLRKQKEAFNNNQEGSIEANRFRQNYNTSKAQPINKNFSSNAFTSDQNIIVPMNGRYPNDIFADRITNYNYIQDDKTVVQNNKSTIQNNNKINNRVVNEQKVLENTNNKIIEGDIISTKIDENIGRQKTYKLKAEKQEKTVKTQPKFSNNSTSANTVKTASAANTKTVVNKSTTKNSKNEKQYYIQIGVYSEKKNADVAYSKYSKISSGSIEEYSVKNQKKYKVLLGPYNDKKVAEQNLEKVIKTGHYDVYITEKK